ncbi:DNA topoisomerase 4 subunit A [Enterobacteriaceae bacterium ET-AT1-13]|nr:DNA topoisomerase 4 subunit A [Enterobacteriaceae bacterium ET-AT1-13]WGS66391.1 DNA topoisomerase 4 subunit A [Enterobacteriaceae bacterium Cmel17]WMC17623.1 MAG: DNA topoisomerase 4 subunit A [Enterobacteriaceae bacterium PSmelAO3-2]WMC17828.1 MAG: DNA topoisomerase 4 subunit A [Enterobacteriaceae bacterium PSmelAO3-1]WMC18031.1 MAG: DNA topoisomerase 4 subunit A [Enterobacteriaceae bacterium PSmelAO1]
MINIKKKKSINIEKELKKSYLDYAMSVIICRALPDVRDGLKPVHRRILYAMYKMNNNWVNIYKKSARIVGDVIGKYHPHGDKAVYDSIVRMSQTFSLRYILIDGQGNFGSIDGDHAAAMRYTEIRMSKIAYELLSDLEKNTVEFIPNYDNTKLIPSVLPSKIPNLLINGSSGIAVGMATNIPPHNLSEVINACINYINNKNITIKKLMKYIPGPDFPTSAIIYGTEEIKKAYKTGRGKILIRANIKIEKNPKNKNENIIIKELPYQVNKLCLIKRILELIKKKKIKEINKIRDESDKDGMRIVIELKKKTITKKILKKLYLLTKLEISFNINMVALHKGQPKLLNIKNILEAFLNHRREIVTRRTKFLLNKIKERTHILEGLIIALINIKIIIKILKKVKTLKEAEKILIFNYWKFKKFYTIIKYSQENFDHHDWLYKKKNIDKKKYYFSINQVKAILDLRLHKLIGMEYNNLITEYKKLIKKSINLIMILKNSKYLINIITEELINLKKNFGDNRRTKIKFNNYELNSKKIISNKNILLFITYKGDINYYKKKINIKKKKYKDLIRCFIFTNIYEKILLFSNFGFLYLVEVKNFINYNFKNQKYNIKNILKIKKNEYINKILSINNIKKFKYIIITTKKGIFKKINIKNFLNINLKKTKIINLNKNDEIIDINTINLNNEIILFSLNGKTIYFIENKIKETNFNNLGVKIINLEKNDKLIYTIIKNNKYKNILIITEYKYIVKKINKNYNKKNLNNKFNIINNSKIISIIYDNIKNYIFIITNKNKIFKINTNNNINKNFLIINKKLNEKIIFSKKIFENIEY